MFGLKEFDIRHLLLLMALWLSTIVSALSVVYVTHDTRLKYHQLETLRRQENNLQVAWSQYLLEESAWAAYSRTEQIAKKHLAMLPPATDHIVIVGL